MPRFLILAAVLAVAGCDSGGPDPTGLDGLSGNPALLAGTWVWERSVTCDGSGGCAETTPAGRTETLAFTHTPETSSHNGTVQGFFNGDAVGPTTYRVDTAATDFFGLSYVSYSLALGEGSRFNQFGVSRDRLVISAAAVDGAETTYRRR